jgi:hypothetical protein
MNGSELVGIPAGSFAAPMVATTTTNGDPTA